MANALRILTEADHEIISQAVHDAEQGSAGEIVTIVTERSDGYTDIALAWAVIAAMTALTSLSVFPLFYLNLIDRALDRWDHAWSPQAILTLAAGMAIVKFLAMIALQMWQPLKFFLVPGLIKSARVRARAVALFRVSAERRTTGRTGILIYLSLAEHRAEIVADEAIAAKVAPEVWGEAMAAMLVNIRAGRIAEGIAAAVEQVGKVLAQHFPRAEDDSNELPDRLIEV